MCGEDLLVPPLPDEGPHYSQSVCCYITTMIWGLALEPGLECTTTTQEEVHLSLAAIESRPDPSDADKAGSYAQLLLKTDSAQQLLCTLVHGTIFQQCLDLKLMAGEKVTFSVEGSFGVFITGYSYKSPSTDARTGVTERAVNRDGITYKRQSPRIKPEPQSDDELFGTPEEGDTMNGDSGTTAAYRDGSDDEPMDSSNGRHHPTHATSLPPPVLSPRAAASGGNSPYYETRTGKFPLNIDGASESSRGSTFSERQRTPGSVDERSKFTTSRTTNAFQVASGPSSQDSVGRAPSNNRWSSSSNHHREIGVRPPLASAEDKFVCPLCSEVFPGKDTLLAHEQLHVDEGEMFGCRYCLMVFVQKGNRDIHERIHSAMRHNIRVGCKVPAGEATASSAAGESKDITGSQHLKTTLEEVMSRETESPEEPETPLSLGRSSPSPSPPPSQEDQGGYPGGKSQSRVNRDKVRPRPYPNYSGLGLRAQGEEERNYRCQFCEKSFKRNYDRNRHERIHTGQKPYECRYCELAFSRREHCRKHESTHVKTPDPLPPEVKEEAEIEGAGIEEAEDEMRDQIPVVRFQKAQPDPHGTEAL